MKLQYRGSSYEQNPQLIEMVESQITANYRGATYKIKQPVQEKARSLMHNQRRTLKNRQQSMLYRAAAELQ
jgi:hypothetical protein